MPLFPKKKWKTWVLKTWKRKQVRTSFPVPPGSSVFTTHRQASGCHCARRWAFGSYDIDSLNKSKPSSTAPKNQNIMQKPTQPCLEKQVSKNFAIINIKDDTRTTLRPSTTKQPPKTFTFPLTIYLETTCTTTIAINNDRVLFNHSSHSPLQNCRQVS